MITLKYKISRLIYGLIIIIISHKSIYDIDTFTNLSKLLSNNINNMNLEEKFYSIINLTFFNKDHKNEELLKLWLDFSIVKDNNKETVKFIYFLLMFGGLMCIFGEPLSRLVIVTALTFDVLLIHNFNFFKNESAKGTMLKYIALIGGALHIC